MSIFWIALPAAIACGILAGIDKGRALRKAQEAMQQTETETGGAPGEISEILVPVYTKLRRAGASCRPWIHDCIVAIEAGQGCDPEIAIAALNGRDLRPGCRETGGAYLRAWEPDRSHALQTLKNLSSW